LTYVGVVGETKKSLIHRYEFPPQEHVIDRARDARDPRTRESAGTIEDLDERSRTIDLKRGRTSQKPHPTALIPLDVMDNTKWVQSGMRLGGWVADRSIDEDGSYRAARDILLRRAPRLTRGSLESFPEDLPPVEAAKRLVLLLDNSALPIQGPPGSGKT